MDKWTFHVQGTAAVPYVVIFEKITKHIKVTCDCPAGLRGKLCKHKLGILTENIKNNTELGKELVNDGYNDSLAELTNCEVSIKQLNDEMVRLKKVLANKMKTN
ncbi:hypothetical protein [Shewanella sp. Isolate7]|uniref:hypothetical protein n=1 Tax=Shewanella sp. Isolate7 TaxID=2908528 RepID=UPI001EFDD714|nr:hypothetical protein [Shewanella sp. Isolate7]MCG9723257.1 hypothetical protein [Shewanella sp. Isolate7]